MIFFLIPNTFIWTYPTWNITQVVGLLNIVPPLFIENERLEQRVTCFVMAYYVCVGVKGWPNQAKCNRCLL